MARTARSNKKVIEELAQELQAVKSDLKDIENSTQNIQSKPVPKKTTLKRRNSASVSKAVKPSSDLTSEVAAQREATQEFLQEVRNSLDKTSAIEEKNRVESVDNIIHETHQFLDDFRDSFEVNAEKQRQERLKYVEQLNGFRESFESDAEKYRQQRLNYVEQLHQQTEKEKQERISFLEKIEMETASMLDEYIQKLESDAEKLQNETHKFMDSIRADLKSL